MFLNFLIFFVSGEYWGCRKDDHSNEAIVFLIQLLVLWSSIVMQKEDVIDWQDLDPLYYHLFGHMKGGLRGKHYACEEEVKTAVIK